MKTYSLILGGYINGYSIIKELHEKKVKNIALFSYKKSLSTYSNKINYYKRIDKTAESLKNEILKLKERTDFIIIYPTDDIQLKNLHTIYDSIKEFCFVPFNHKNLLNSLNKYIQYEYCKKYNIPYPKTIEFNTKKDIQEINKLLFPILIKPNKKNSKYVVFRSLLVHNTDELNAKSDLLTDFLNKGFTFLASEYIPGDDTNIYAYVGYRSKNGLILNEWIGKKLTQFPDNFGVFSSASNEAPTIVKEQGRKLLEVMDLHGICEPEFKYDSRDGKYKLTEINLRSMMWHRVGNLSGVNIQYTQYLDATNQAITRQEQNQTDRIHYVYMKHEILNLLGRKGYWKFFKHNVFSKNKTYFAVFELRDIKPFFFDLLSLTNGIYKLWLKALKGN